MQNSAIRQCNRLAKVMKDLTHINCKLDTIESRKFLHGTDLLIRDLEFEIEALRRKLTIQNRL